MPLGLGAQHWIDRAKEARALADQVDDPEAKRAMLEVAERYEIIAEQCPHKR